MNNKISNDITLIMKDYINEIKKELNELKLDNLLSVIIILLSTFNIIGDLIEQEGIIENDSTKKELSHDIYKLALLGSLVLYFVFFKRNANELNEAATENKDLFPYKIRQLGSTLFIIATLCIIYFNISDPENIDSPEI